MDNLLEQVEHARRKLIRDAFFRRLVWWLAGALLVATVAIAAPKVVAIAGLPAWWAEACLIGGVSVAVVGAGVVTYLRRSDRHEAAAELDRRFDLRERVASSLSLPESEHASEMGQALIADAARSAQGIDIAERFPVRVGRQAWLPVLPAVAAVVLIALVGDRPQADATTPNPATAEAEQAKRALQKESEKLRKKIAESKDKEALKDATDLLKKVEKGIDEVALKDTADRKKAVVKLNDLAKSLEDRKQQLGGSKALRDELNKLKDLAKGPAKKAAEAMKEGDWKKALDEIEKLRKQMAEGKLPEDQQKKLAEQMGQIKEQLQKSLDKQEQAIEDLKKQIDEQKRKGNNAEAGELQRKLDQMQQNQQQRDKLQQLADQMSKAQQAMQQGDQQAAADAMKQMADQMQQMQQELEEMEMLDGALDQIEMAKQAMGCEACRGGDGMGMNPGNGQGQGKGMGMGEGQGSGPRPDEQNPTSMRDTRVRQKPGAGASTFSGFVDGPNIKGNVREALKQEPTADDVAPAEAMDDARLPRSRREHAREYFEKLREEL
ncbi:MAG: hypothetical protein AAF790_12480 [Planctomycetota bacterium]